MSNNTHLIVLRDLLRVIEQLRPIVKTIRSHDRELADQLRDAVSSAALNLSEGAGSSGGTRRARYETSLGSTQETRTCLRVAAAWGYIEARPDLDDRLDHCAARIYKLRRRG
jgi:four helix bundle protein